MSIPEVIIAIVFSAALLGEVAHRARVSNRRAQAEVIAWNERADRIRHAAAAQERADQERHAEEVAAFARATVPTRQLAAPRSRRSPGDTTDLDRVLAEVFPEG